MRTQYRILGFILIERVESVYTGDVRDKPFRVKWKIWGIPIFIEYPIID